MHAGSSNGWAAGIRVVFVSNSDHFFLSHRLPVAQAIRDAGADVWIANPNSGSHESIEALGFRAADIPLERRTVRPHREAHSVATLSRLYHRLRPDIIDHHTLKPILYGSIAARTIPNAAVINLVGGLGYLFTDVQRARALRALASVALRVALARPRTTTVFQNEDDRGVFVARSLVQEHRTTVIPGSGVDTASTFFPRETTVVDPPVIMYVGRLLKDKGVGEFVESARKLRRRRVGARFVVVGPLDPGNPAAVSSTFLRGAVDQGDVEWWGQREDMPNVYRQATVVVLPSYREGMSKTLMEAAAMGLPAITTDVPGCSHVVEHGITGYLIPPRDADALSDAVATILDNDELRVHMGVQARKRAVADFDINAIVDGTLSLYRTSLL